MVTVFLRGGLGNQMFQYAAGFALAKKNKTELFLDTVFLNDRFPRKNFSYRTYDLNIFTLTPSFTTLSKCSQRLPIPALWLGMDLIYMKAADMLGSHTLIKTEEEFTFDSSLFEEKGNLILWGRWQNEKYFKDITGEIRDAFTFRDPFVGGAETIAEDIQSSNSVSIHIRRGDFIAFKNVAQMMGGMDLSYYDRAVAYVARSVHNPKLFIFSDDIEWCKKNVKLPFPTVYVPHFTEGYTTAFHLHLMSLCKHNIIANSTFSWWGAWLNQNSGKTVVAPKKWYADGRDEKSDFMPADWIKL